MAVLTRYIVVRNGVEQDRIFEVKKEADAFDKMLEAAENLTDFISNSDLEIKLQKTTIEAIALVLAKNGPTVAKILRNVKPVTPAPETKPAPKSKKGTAAAKPGTKRKGAK